MSQNLLSAAVVIGALRVNPYLANIFVLNMSSAYCICNIYFNALQTSFITEAKTKHPDQTIPKEAV